jgi:uncharacterized protein (TIGR02996 family)
MLNNAAAFITALEENEDDEATRLIYADWLEEQGQYEEAQRQRKWTAAKAWIAKLLKDCRGDFEEDDDPDAWCPIPSFQRICRMAQDALAEMERDGDDRVVMELGANDRLTETLREQRHGFWANWSIVTGVPLPEGLADRSFFGCSC